MSLLVGRSRVSCLSPASSTVFIPPNYNQDQEYQEDGQYNDKKRPTAQLYVYITEHKSENVCELRNTVIVSPAKDDIRLERGRILEVGL